ncbi:ATP-binding cassette domain-containing protein [Parapedobacter tibetensis]|uniref:ATP-binding cassette domain-containing protein n=1 Tax=Parapedobacter tibetensis TaxID=2972951 RepID=UPI00214DF097|nr:ATP-binding cassette domain-containing protein [Parapedobacter tibetensis]
MDSPSELIIDSAQCRFGNRNVLNAVFLNCGLGEIVGVLGRNGSGKSVLLKMIFGIEKGQFKHLTINGKIVKKAFLTGQVGYLPQKRLLPSSSKVGFAVNMLTTVYRDDLLQNEHVKRHLNDKMGDLSGGLARLIEGLIILYGDPPFVLLDEPFLHLEPMLKLLFIDEIDKFKAKKGIIITDHSYRDILGISDRIVLIHNGSNYQIQKEEDLITHGYVPDVL